MKKTEILQTLKALKPQYQKDGLILVGLFGSFSRGEEQSDSDIDIVYEIEKNQKFSMFKYLGDLEKSLNHKVDLVRVKTIKADLKPYIYLCLGIGRKIFIKGVCYGTCFSTSCRRV
jgi:uncharacterized protein